MSFLPKIRARSGVLSHCLDYDVQSSNVKLGICNSNKKTQQWRDAEAASATTTTTTTTVPHLRFDRRSLFDYNTCLDHDTSDGHLFVSNCSESDSQLWYHTKPQKESDGWEWTEVKTKSDPSKCLSIKEPYEENKPQMVDCATSGLSEGSTTKWEFRHGQLKVPMGRRKEVCITLDEKTNDVVMEKCALLKPQLWRANNDPNLHRASCCQPPIIA
mmetsp:Transcript_27919/g.50845  ORF Transcript_27919/g.50845 Transcript_27919/m.50845 type:complete len:215 (+) Transcript_27919:228-872(+)